MSTRHDEEVHRSSKETTIKENEWEIENVIVEKACNPLGYWDAVEPALECECETGIKKKRKKHSTSTCMTSCNASPLSGKENRNDQCKVSQNKKCICRCGDTQKHTHAKRWLALRCCLKGRGSAVQL